MIKRFLYIGILSMGLYSCQDTLDVVQEGELTDPKVFTNVENSQLFLNTAYGSLNIFSEQMLSSMITDEVGIGDALPAGEATYRFQIYDTNVEARLIWETHYLAINNANRVLRGLTYFTPAAGEEVAYNNIKAQAMFLRAFSHFQLLTYFSTDLKNDNALGVMKLDFVPTPNQQIPRATNGEIFALIESDLAFAEANLTNATTGPNSWKYVNINTVNSLRARMYLYRGMHTQAEQYADYLINNSGISLASSSFTLPENFPATTSTIVPTGPGTGSNSRDAAPTGPNSAIQLALYKMDRHEPNPTDAPDYRKMWVDQIQGEMIFSLARPVVGNGNLSMTYNTNQSDTQGGSRYDVGRTLFNLLTEDLGGGAQDFRRWSFVDRSSTISQDPATATNVSEVIVVDKYPGKVGGHAHNDIKVFRMSEMYFIKAEARVAAGDLVGAASLIQQVRQARNYIAGTTVPTPTYGSAQEAYADILKERRKELCFEGHRYIDIKRLGAVAGISGTDRYFKDSENGSATNPYNIAYDDYRFTLPIPRTENVANSLVQNPGY
ncbi:MAG: RagB/SusD family nutrient uptake outer membrane protein [Bacteroidota bacterium]|nr:RagB/SusD family nutrient uptake outer membrane protein [Bacteroidota bacterium]